MSRWRGWRRGALAAVALTLVHPGPAGAEDDAPVRFAKASAALSDERVEEAIAELEALADRGVRDAAVSFNRGLAYALRVRLGREASGDLGRAVFAFEEARRLTRDASTTADCAQALEELRAEIARRRAHAGEPGDLAAESTPWWSAVHIASEGTWIALAALASVVATAAVVGLALARGRRVRVALYTGGSLAATLLVVTLPLALAARHERTTIVDAIIVGDRTRLAGPDHVALPDRPSLPEGSRVRIEERSGGWVRVSSVWGDGYVPAPRALVLPR